MPHAMDGDHTTSSLLRPFCPQGVTRIQFCDRGLLLSNLRGLVVPFWPNNNNKVARASAAVRGVSFIVGRFFWSKSGKPCNLRGFRQQHDVSVFAFPHVFCSCFLVAFLRKCRKYHAFLAFIKLIFCVVFEVFVWKAAKTRGFCMVDVSKVKQ